MFSRTAHILDGSSNLPTDPLTTRYLLRGDQNPSFISYNFQETLISRVILTVCSIGQHPKNPPDVLQGQRLQEAHPAQSHPIQGRKGQQTLHDTKKYRGYVACTMYTERLVLGLVIRPG
ncbi:hypothetical protein FQN49_004391 [Arthroderma sp. PD_2]|nr:hypothetical protein FQN49_004391 [Arthroderma sp. PD_2]